MLLIPVMSVSLALLPLAHTPASEAITVLAGQRVQVIEHCSRAAQHLWVPATAVETVTGFTLKPEGLCAGEICIPLPRAGSADSWTREHEGQTLVDVTAFAEHVKQPFASSEDGKVWSFGPASSLESPLLSGQAPDFELQDREGNTLRLSDFRGSKVLLLTWASW